MLSFQFLLWFQSTIHIYFLQTLKSAMQLTLVCTIYLCAHKTHLYLDTKSDMKPIHSSARPQLGLVSCLSIQNGLTAHNWQKWESTFLTCPCHKICREEAVGLKSYNYTLKITIFVNMWNLGQFLENLIFFNNCIIKIQI